MTELSNFKLTKYTLWTPLMEQNSKGGIYEFEPLVFLEMHWFDSKISSRDNYSSLHLGVGAKISLYDVFVVCLVSIML